MNKPVSEWSYADLEALIEAGVQESLTLDYKRSAALVRTSSGRNELSKDVSAFANSAGGRIVYGVVERGHRPEHLDEGISDPAVTREWLEQTINSTIQPRIQGLVIKQISFPSGSWGFVIDIPQAVSLAPHQANEHRYYKRFNFESRPMEDYEVKDALRRADTADLFAELKWAPCNPGVIGLESACHITIGNRSSAITEYSTLTVFIDQLASVAANPDWSRVGPSRVFESLDIKTYSYSRNLAVPQSMPIWKGKKWAIGSFALTFDRHDSLLVGWVFEWPGGTSSHFDLYRPRNSTMVAASDAELPDELRALIRR